MGIFFPNFSFPKPPKGIGWTFASTSKSGGRENRTLEPCLYRSTAVKGMAGPIRPSAARGRFHRVSISRCKLLQGKRRARHFNCQSPRFSLFHIFQPAIFDGEVPKPEYSFHGVHMVSFAFGDRSFLYPQLSNHKLPAFILTLSHKC